MKKIAIVLLLLCGLLSKAQIRHYNQFPALPPLHLLDNEDLLDEISFAYAMRVLKSDYEGPLVRLRRASDNAEQDFYCNAEDKVDVAAIDTWSNGANVFVSIWYDQSGENRNAVQNNNALQPQFFSDPVVPYFVGDGNNDFLRVEGTINEVVPGGKNASITGVYWATNRADSAFGSVNQASPQDNDRWLTHFNWSNGQVFFDPGYCCNNPRSFINNLPTAPNNPGKLDAWGQYTVIRRDNPNDAAIDRTILRQETVEKVNGGFADFQAFSQTNFPFAICAVSTNAQGTTSSGNSNTRFTEMIAHSEGKSDAFVLEIEENQIAFWEL